MPIRYELRSMPKKNTTTQSKYYTDIRILGKSNCNNTVRTKSFSIPNMTTPTTTTMLKKREKKKKPNNFDYMRLWLCLYVFGV